MPSPPPSSEMDFDFEGNWPASEVTNLTTDARTVATLPPTLATVLTTQKELILDEMDIQIGLIKSRSQDLGDGQVTIYDKALLDLTVNGIQVDNNSAIIFWCQHYCGTDPVNAPNNTARILQQKLAVRVVMNQGKRNPRSHQSHLNLTSQQQSKLTSSTVSLARPSRRNRKTSQNPSCSAASPQTPNTSGCSTSTTKREPNTSQSLSRMIPELLRRRSFSGILQRMP